MIINHLAIVQISPQVYAVVENAGQVTVMRGGEDDVEFDAIPALRIVYGPEKLNNCKQYVVQNRTDERGVKHEPITLT